MLVDWLKKLAVKGATTEKIFASFSNDDETLELRADNSFFWSFGSDTLEGTWEWEGTPPFDTLYLDVEGAAGRLVCDVGYGDFSGSRYHGISFSMENDPLRVTRVYLAQ